MSTEVLRIFDTTLRDGEQSPGCSMNLHEKLTLARQLERLGVDVIEAGFPIASEGDFEAVRAVARDLKETSVCGLARTGRQDVERAAQALEGAVRPRIHTFIATSDIHLQHKLRMSREQVLIEVDRAVRQARGYCDDVEFSAEDATRSDWDYLVEVFRVAIEAGASTLNVPDTVGYTQPEEYAALIRTLRERVPGSERAVFSVHCHNDLGLAVANSLAAVRAGRARSSAPSTGSASAGNTSMEEVVMAVRRGRRCSPAWIPGSAPRRSTRQAGSCRPSSACRCSPTRRSSARMPSPTRPGSTRMACSRRRSRTRS
jgi:2-isopropylmalate synthase